MKLKLGLYLVVFFFCGAAIGLWGGQIIFDKGTQAVTCRPATTEELDLFYSSVLKISDSQKSEILGIEKSYQDRRDIFTKRMQHANIRLADVIEKEGYTSKKIEPLVAEIHTAMGELQTLSLTHLASVERVLDQEQAKLLKRNAVSRLRQN